MNIYIHIPFCRQACNYCNFHFVTSLVYKEDMIGAMEKEVELQKDFIDGEEVETIYFGGGTPSLLSGVEISRFLIKVRETFRLAPSAEITLEANPDDINEDALLSWKQAGVNRLSIGVQSFREEDLRWMNRAHNAAQALESLRLATKTFSNITADLIYGIPGLSDEDWKENVKRLIASGVQHISCYALTVEANTPLAKMVREKKMADTDQDVQARQFLLLIEWLRAEGFEHYEISNFARPGFRSRHNSAYWSIGPDGKGERYLGLGPSAHSFNGSSRQWNVANNQQYIRSIQEGKIPAVKEELDPVQRKNEYLMTALRTAEGIELSRLDQEERQRLQKISSPYADKGYLELENDRIRLTDRGKLFADGIAADLFE
jgi:oxygen-independent coproporphyrinogen-3 oxidase